MQVKQILQRKGHEVMTASPGTPLPEAVRMLETHRIGALVITDDEGRVQGIFSERDLVSAVARHGEKAMQLSVGEVMTRDILTCCMDDTTDTLMQTMTEHRVRHLPVVEDGQLAGLVSIGDVVKQRMEEIAFEAEQMKMYIATG